MQLQKIYFFIFSLLLLALFSSCSEDSELQSAEEFQASSLSIDDLASNRRGGSSNDNRNPDKTSASSTNTIQVWNNLFLDLDRYATGMRPNATARAIAYIQLAAYETALPSMRDFVSNEDRLRGLEIPRSPNPRDIDPQLALNAAFAITTDHFLINLPDNNRAEISQLENSMLQNLSGDISPDRIQASIEWGQLIANQVIAYSQTDEDGESQILEPQPLSYEPPTGEGIWTYSAEPERALFPYWGSVRTFAVSADETSSIPPTAYSLDPISEYYLEMQEVYDANNQARIDNAEQLWIAEFWSDDVETLMFSPPARQVSIANQLIEQYDMNMDDALHLLVKVGFALNDAAVSTWDDKYKYMVMRPSVYIQNHIDPTYQTNLYRLIPWPNPTFPAYPSGHSTFASAAAGVFIDFFGNATNFIDRSHEGRTEFQSAPRSKVHLDHSLVLKS